MLISVILDARSRRIALAINPDVLPELDQNDKLELDDLEDDEKPAQLG